MSEMVERVAEALCQTALGGPMDRLSPDSRDGYREMARAAIEAVREPTEAMRQAVVGDINSPVARMLMDSWRAMIDAALGS